MSRWWTGPACLILFTAYFACDGRAQEQPPSLEFLPDTEIVPSLRERVRSQPKTLFSETIGGFGISRRSFNGPMDVAHDAEGNYFVLDAGNNRVQKFTERDRFELQWGSSGSSEGEFSKPRAIIVDPEDFVYVVDSGNHRIQKFDSEGEFLASLGSLGAAPGKFNTPIDMTFDSEGNVFVLDAGNTRIQKFDPSGIFVDEWGRFSGGRKGDFTRLHSIAWFDERFGFLYLLGEGVEEGSCLVQILSLHKGREEVEKSWDVVYPYDNVETCVPTRIEIDNSDDYVYILDHVNNVIRRFHMDGRYIDSIWEVEEPFNAPMGFTVMEHTRKVWIADTGSDVVQRFSLR
jgi:hypothetical protein